MSLTGGKRKGNKSLKAWVSFVKRVQKEEKLSYKDAIHRAKVRKDKGEKWMRGGDMDEAELIVEQGPTGTEEEEFEEGNMMEGGRRRRTRRRRGSRRARRTMRRRRGSRRH
jgi:hypothetical protein